MTENDSPEKAPGDGRGPDGRFAPGNNLGIPFGPDNPPPRSPGRPKRDAWVAELESRLEDPRMRQALADRILKIALKGSERAALQAAELIQTRVAGPVPHHVQAEIVSESRQIVIVGTPQEPPALPAQVRELERLRGEAEERAQGRREQSD